jgi:LysR family transcriptional activator of dmlA
MVDNDWDLLHLKVFTSIYRQGSFVKAASELGISPAYVSKMIAELEKALKVSLLRRTTRRVQVTSEGEIAYSWAIQVLKSAENLKQEVAASQSNLMGSLKICTSLRLGRNHLSNILALFNEKYPDLNIWLELVDRRVDLLKEGVDIDLRVGDVEEPHLISHHVVKAKRVLCASPEYLRNHAAPQNIKDLAQHSCLPFRDRIQPYGVWQLEGPDGAHTVRVTGKVGSNHSDVARTWATLGRGIILLSDWDIHDEIESGSLVRVLPEYSQSADVVAVTPARLSSSLKLKLCVDFLIKNLQKGPFSLKTFP